MHVHVARDVRTNESTTGVLAIDGVPFGFTLEDRVREPGVKVYGKTAIPAGAYVLEPHRSPRFGMTLPRIMRVTARGLMDPEGFAFCLVHNGTHAGHTLGCVLIAYERGPDRLIDSPRAAALHVFLARWFAAMAKGQRRVTFTIRNTWEA